MSDNILLNGTLADPSTLAYVSNPNTLLSTSSLTSINSTISTAGLPLNIGPALSLVDCALNLEERIIAKAQEKTIELLMSNSNANAVIGAINKTAAYLGVVQEIVNIVKGSKSKDLLSELAIAKALQGLQRVAKIQEILNTFGNNVNNIAELISKLDVLDICSTPNYTTSGAVISPPIFSPSSQPISSPPTYPGATVHNIHTEAKDTYDALMFELKNFTGKDSTKTSDASYVSMITSINTIALAYHDKLMKSTTNADDSKFAAEFKNSVGIELNNHNAEWDDDIKNDYNNRCNNIGIVLGRSGDIIRAYAMRNQIGPVSGSIISSGVTWYGGPNSDFTTFLDIKPSQRPAELTTYWQSKGYNIQSQEAKLNGRGIKTGTLNYDDAFKGPFGDRLISDFSCASTRVPIGSVLALKNPDGTPYNPSGKNPSGVYTVHDTGNAELTYRKVDIFTLNPDPYKSTNMSGVQVFLVSNGTKKAPQYKLAQSRYNRSNAV